MAAGGTEGRSHDEAGDGFGLMRIAAALMVIVAHSFPIANGAPDPTWHRGQVDLSFGSGAVDIFFVISGYLVTASFIRDPHLLRFPVRRIARIWPGLVVMLFLTTWVLGTLVTTLPRGTYLTNPGTLRYFLASVMLMPVWDLPGVFQTNVAPGVNGSIWTLPIEVTAYAGLLVFGPLLVMRGRRRVVVAAAIGGVVVAAAVLAPLLLPQAILTGLKFLLHQSFLLFFITGTILNLGRQRVPLTWPLFALAATGLLATLVVGLLLPMVVFFSYAVIFLSTRQGPVWHRMTKLGDPSYGIYIYAYPIQQFLVSLRVAPTWWTLLIEASLASIIVGYLSWHIVECRALGFARRALRPRGRVVVRPSASAAA